MKRKALTVGELLITMTIIGIIAILVVPSLLTNYHNNLYSSRIKKVYSLVLTAIEQACTESNVSQISYTKYFSSTGHQEFLNTYFKTVPTTKYFASSYSSIGTTNEEDTGVTIPTSKVKLKSGEAIGMSCADGNCTFTVDTNALDKPNIAGKDLFVFTIDGKTHNLVPGDTATCLTSTSGVGCFERLYNNNWKMNY